MIQLEILGRTTIHATGPVAAINGIDHLARNRRTFWRIPEELARIDKFHPDLLFKFATALPFFQLRGYLRLFPIRSRPHTLGPFLFLHFIPETKSLGRSIEFQNYITRKRTRSMLSHRNPNTLCRCHNQGRTVNGMRNPYLDALPLRDLSADTRHRRKLHLYIKGVQGGRVYQTKDRATLPLQDLIEWQALATNTRLPGLKPESLKLALAFFLVRLHFTNLTFGLGTSRTLGTLTLPGSLARKQPTGDTIQTPEQEQSRKETPHIKYLFSDFAIWHTL